MRFRVVQTLPARPFQVRIAPNCRRETADCRCARLLIEEEMHDWLEEYSDWAHLAKLIAGLLSILQFSTYLRLVPYAPPARFHELNEE
jgi:hypothetical protein